MRQSRRVRWVLLLAAGLLMVLVWTLPTRGQVSADASAEPSEPTGVELRLVGMLHQDGRVEVALQYWWNGAWSRGVFPQRRFLPADADEGRWLVSAPVRTTSLQSQVRFAVEHPRWDGARGPGANRPGASGPGEFVVRVDGQRFLSSCGVLDLELDQGRLRLQSRDDTCSSETPLEQYADLIARIKTDLQSQNYQGGAYDLPRVLKTLGVPEYADSPGGEVSVGEATNRRAKPRDNPHWEGIAEALQQKIAYDVGTLVAALEVTISVGGSSTEGATPASRSPPTRCRRSRSPSTSASARPATSGRRARPRSASVVPSE